MPRISDTPANLLRDTISFYGHREWTQKVCARDARGIETNIHNPKAVCWCLEAALSRVQKLEDYSSPSFCNAKRAVLASVKRLYRASTVWEANDKHFKSKNDAVTVLKHAVRLVS